MYLVAILDPPDEVYFGALAEKLPAAA